MTIYAIYQVEDGRLVSTTNTASAIASPSVLEARGYAVTERPDAEAGGLWNAATLQFDPAPAVREPLTPFQFKARLTTAERIAIRAARATDPIVEDFLDMLDSASEVLLDNPETIAGMQYMVSINLLTAERAAEVLS